MLDIHIAIFMGFFFVVVFIFLAGVTLGSSEWFQKFCARSKKEEVREVKNIQRTDRKAL